MKRNKLFKAMIEVLIEAESEGDAHDKIVESLLPLLRDFQEVGETSALVDWRYDIPSVLPVEIDAKSAAEEFERAR
jgi:hypothetical protein